jgi:hypothetical protein
MEDCHVIIGCCDSVIQGNSESDVGGRKEKSQQRTFQCPRKAGFFNGQSCLRGKAGLVVPNGF